VPFAPSKIRNGWFVEALKNALGYSLVVDRIMSTIDPEGWELSTERAMARIQGDSVEVSCRLLQRLKIQAEQRGVRVLLLANYGAQEVEASDIAPGAVRLVTQCARSMGYQVVDMFETLRRAYRANPDELKKYYVMTRDVPGHNSVFGNLTIARALAAALAQPAPTGVASSYESDDFVAGQGKNLIPLSESLDSFIGSTPSAEFRRLPLSPNRLQEYELQAVGGKAEHYVTSNPIELAGGPYTLSFEVAPDSVQMVRVQLLAEGPTGLWADIDFTRQVVAIDRLGVARKLSGTMEKLEDGWYRISVGATIPFGDARFIFQLAGPAGEYNFPSDNEKARFRAVQLERGQSASEYRATSGVRSPGYVPGDGENLVVESESLLVTRALATFEKVSPPPTSPQEYTLTAEGPSGEHYVFLSAESKTEGPHTFSLQVRTEGTRRIRLQLHDATLRGVIGDFDLGLGRVLLRPRGQVDGVDGTIQPSQQGWFSLSLSAQLTPGNSFLYIQLQGDDGANTFEPHGEAIRVRAVQLEWGNGPSGYRAMSK